MSLKSVQEPLQETTWGLLNKRQGQRNSEKSLMSLGCSLRADHDDVQICDLCEDIERPNATSGVADKETSGREERAEKMHSCRWPWFSSGRTKDDLEYRWC